jgi:uracil-DNA glycosylase family 4
MKSTRDSRCETCPLRAQPFVTGVGRDDPRYVIVGEAPGKAEVATGVPFTGYAGKELRKALIRNGIERNSDAFLTNTVLCRPPPKPDDSDNRPSTSAIKACFGRLIQEITSHDPDAVLALGEPATRTLLQSGEGIRRLREKGCQESPFVKPPVVATLHPASRERNRLDVITADVAKLVACGDAYRRTRRA